MQSVETEEAFIIGGEEIYRLSLPYVNRIYLTRIHHEFDGDSFFPAFDEEHWKLISEEFHKKDEKNEYDFTFCCYERVKDS